MTVGRSDAGIVLDTPNAPALLGTLTVDGGAIGFEAAPGVDVQVNGKRVTKTALSDDSAGAPTVLEVGSLKAHVIKRKDQRFLRVKDREHPARQRFDALSWFEPAPAWRVRGTFEAADAGVFIEVTNVLGQVEPQPVRGTVAFRLDGGTQRLVALDGTDGGLFLIFKDATAGRSTYGAGRFLDTPAPTADGRVEVDFNRAVNPPCAFTAFATCPLPPRANVLKVAIEAGERAPTGGHL
ncbi:MAG: DUF1684 domain-containing protein [Myxococcaceae bacterium]|nr:DUF1684 domain-containing protein [Myxococcaceae bacterium]